LAFQGVNEAGRVNFHAENNFIQAHLVSLMASKMALQPHRKRNATIF
jgi:hypothetical protein